MRTPNDIGEARVRELGQLPVSGWSRVQKLSLIRREVRETLAPSAFLALFSAAEIVVEGGFEAGPLPNGGRRAYVTVMVTMDLELHRAKFREACDQATAHRLCELMTDQSLVQRKLTELAKTELARLTNLEAEDLEVQLDYRVHTNTTKVLLDADAMTTVFQPKESLSE